MSNEVNPMTYTGDGVLDNVTSEESHLGLKETDGLVAVEAERKNRV